MGWTGDLHGTLDKRAMPEDIARIILRGNREWPEGLRHELSRVAAARPAWGWSSMADDFERPDGCAVQLASAARVFGLTAAADVTDPADPGQGRQRRPGGDRGSGRGCRQ